jgi:hypothetical protein
MVDTSNCQIIYQGKYGSTIRVSDPRLSAYKQAAYIRLKLGRKYLLSVQADGCYTVAGDRLEPITFAPAT